MVQYEKIAAKSINYINVLSKTMYEDRVDNLALVVFIFTKRKIGYQWSSFNHKYYHGRTRVENKEEKQRQ